MTPAILALIIQGLQAAISAAPQLKEIYQNARDLINNLFSAKAITIDQQNALHAHIDAIETAFENGQEPPAWQVEPDPID